MAVAVGTTDLNIRFVATAAKGGDDGENGYSLENSKALVGSALSSLPTFGSGASARHSGTITVLPGSYSEDNPLEFNEDLKIIGFGPDANTGTVIKPSNADHLFAPTASFTDWAHNCSMENLRLDGTVLGTDNYDLLRLYRGGFNCQFVNVNFNQAPRYGLVCINNAVNVYCYNITAGGADGGAIYLYVANGANLFNFGCWGIQFDNCQDTPVLIESNSSGDGNNIIFSGVETETNGTDHDKVFVLRPTGGTNGVQVSIDGASCWSQTSGRTAVVYEESGSGAHFGVNLANIRGSGYTKAYQSAKAGTSSTNNHIGAWTRF